MSLTRDELFPATLKGLAVALHHLSSSASSAVRAIEAGLVKNARGEDGNPEIRSGLGALAETACTAKSLSTITLPWIGFPAASLAPPPGAPVGSCVRVPTRGESQEDFELRRSPGRPVPGFQPVPPTPPPAPGGGADELDEEPVELGGEELDDPLMDDEDDYDEDDFAAGVVCSVVDEDEDEG